MRDFCIIGIINVALLVGPVSITHAETSLTTKALEALDKALEKPSRIGSKPSPPPFEQKPSPQKPEPQKVDGIDLTENSILGATEIYLGMTCKQVNATLGTFKDESCCAKKRYCLSNFKVTIYKLRFNCEMLFDDNSKLTSVLLVSDDKPDTLKNEKITSTEWYNEYLEKIKSIYGAPSKSEQMSTENKLWWVLNKSRFVLSIHKDQHITIGISN